MMLKISCVLLLKIYLDHRRNRVKVLKWSRLFPQET